MCATRARLSAIGTYDAGPWQHVSTSEPTRKRRSNKRTPKSNPRAGGRVGAVKATCHMPHFFPMAWREEEEKTKKERPAPGADSKLLCTASENGEGDILPCKGHYFTAVPCHTNGSAAPPPDCPGSDRYSFENRSIGVYLASFGGLVCALPLCLHLRGTYRENPQSVVVVSHIGSFLLSNAWYNTERRGK